MKKTTLNPLKETPLKKRKSHLGTKNLILRAGLELLTERGFSAVGIDEILKKINVPKGSFYYYFDSKESFGLEIIALYGVFYEQKLRKSFDNLELSPLERIQDFIDSAKKSMSRFDFNRGCLIGNLGQEMGSLPESFRLELLNTFNNWQSLLSECLNEAKDRGDIPKKVKTKELSAFFWIGWEGAVLRAKLERCELPLITFSQYFFKVLVTN